MDSFKILTSIMNDLSMACDTLDHGILLSKLQYYGILIFFLHNYLSWRT